MQDYTNRKFHPGLDFTFKCLEIATATVWVPENVVLRSLAALLVNAVLLLPPIDS